MEHLLLGGVSPGDELHVVHEEDVGGAVLVPELLVLAGADVSDEFVGEVLPADVDDLIVRVILVDGVGNGVEQVGFAQTGFPVDEEGVVILRRVLCHCQGGGVGQLVGVAHHEAFEGVFLGAWQKTGRGLGFLELGFPLLPQDHHVQVGGEQVVQGPFDVLCVPGYEDIPLELRGHG